MLLNIKRCSFLSIAAQHCIACVYSCLFIHLPVEGYSGCFQICVTMNEISVNIHVNISFSFSWINTQKQNCQVQCVCVLLFSHCHVQLFATPWTPLSFTISQSLLKFMPTESVMPSNNLIICCFLLLLQSVFPSIRLFPNESAFHIRQPKYWSFNFSNSSSNEYSELISFRIDWFDLLAVHGTLKNVFMFIKSHQAISYVAISFCSPSEMKTSSNCFTSLPTLGIIRCVCACGCGGRGVCGTLVCLDILLETQWYFVSSVQIS